MLESPGKKDQIFLLLFEPDMAELFYALLTRKEYSAFLKEKILKVIKYFTYYLIHESYVSKLVICVLYYKATKKFGFQLIDLRFIKI